MKPYLAVLYDSFVESVRSRVLWMLLLAWSLLLAALFPLTISSTESYKLGFRSFSTDNSPKQILDQLADASANRGPPAVQEIFQRLSSDFQLILQQREKTKDQEKTKRKISIGMLVEELNQLLPLKDLYKEEVWPKAKSRTGIKELIAKASLNDQEQEKLNRRLLSMTFPNRINHADGQATIVTWANLPLSAPFQLPIDAVRSIAETVIFPMVMRIGLGGIAMLIAIVITSSMIPDMFQTGSLYLLLSKPISRNLLFLTKFLGGCIFVAINITYLLAGLYIYAGTRLGTWNNGILWCIPLFLFMFVVYYSVSSLVGLIWKNPIVCVVVTAVFWAACFGVGFLHFFFQFAVEIRPQVNKVLAVHDTVITGTMQGRVQYWDSSNGEWKLAYGDVDGLQLMGPVWVESNKSLFFARSINDVLGLTGSSTPRLDFARLPDLADPQDKTYRSKPWADARLDSGPVLPPNSVQMFPWKDSFAVFNQNGLYAFDLSATEIPEKQYPAITAMLESFWKQDQPELPGFKPILTSLELASPFDLCTTPNFNRVLAVTQGDLHVWKSDGDQYTQEGIVQRVCEPGTVCLIVANNDFCLVCPNGKKAVVVDLNKQTIHRDLNEIGLTTIKQVQVSGDGQFALLDITNQVWTVPADGSTAQKPSMPGQKAASAMFFSSSGKLWVAHHTNQVDLWNLQTGKSDEQIRPNLTTLERSFYYLVHPFYLVNPKPSSVSQTIDYVMAKPDKRVIAMTRNDLEQPNVIFDPWQPLWSNALFVIVMLSTCCWYLYRQDL